MGYLALDRYRNIEAELSAFCDRWNVAELALLDLPEAERTSPGAELDVSGDHETGRRSGRCSTRFICRMSFQRSLAAKLITVGPDWWSSAISPGRNFSEPWRTLSMLQSDRNAVGHIRDACRRITSFVGPVPASDFHADSRISSAMA